jgi:hypothetical protein
MKRFFLSLCVIMFASRALATCPTGGWVSVESSEYQVVGDSESCPSGYNEVIDPDIMPEPTCDTTKGVCSTVCEVPTSCN